MTACNRKAMAIQRGNIRLSASLDYPGNIQDKKIPLVIFMHALMMDSREPIFNRIADRLLKSGVAILRFDFSGHGNSL